MVTIKLLTYIQNGTQKIGVLSADGEAVYAFDSLGLDFSSMQDFIERHEKSDFELIKSKIAAGLSGVPYSSVTLCAPIPNPRRDLLCIGQNYTAHAIESAKFLGAEYKKPQYPVIFSKRATEAVPSGGVIPAHADITSMLDYEGELAVIIGKACSHVDESDVYGHIFGYTIVNDISARELQQNHKQFFLGKSLDGATPMGPVIVTSDEIGAPPSLDIQTKVNGELRQSSNTSDFVFSIAALISLISAGITLFPGDILITGTPAGVGAGFSPPRFLKPGDVIECEIEKIGVLRNTVG